MTQNSFEGMIVLTCFLQPWALKLLPTYFITLISVTHLVTLPLYLLVNSKRSSLRFFMKWKTGKAKLLIFCFSESCLQESRPLSVIFVLVFLRNFQKQKCIFYYFFVNSVNYIVSKCNLTILLFKCLFRITSWIAWKQSNEIERRRTTCQIMNPTELWNSSHLLLLCLLSGVEALLLVTIIEIPAISILLLFSVRSNINYMFKFTCKTKSPILGKSIHIIIHFHTATILCIDHDCSFSRAFILWIAFLAISQLCESFFWVDIVLKMVNLSNILLSKYVQQIRASHEQSLSLAACKLVS